jgi:6-phosphogluconolactonase
MKSKDFIIRGATMALMLFSAVGARAYAGGAAYTMTNAADDNQIVVFSRDNAGLLTQVGAVSTGGKGSGGGIDPLGSQGSLVLVDNDDGHHGWRRHGHGGKHHGGELLLAVNAGSNDVSVFRVGGHGIKLQDRTGAGGSFPVSLTVSGDRVYVLNNGAPANITGFKLDRHGRLHSLPNSTRLLGDGSYGQVAFDSRGKALIITDKANNRLLVYRVHHGVPAADPVVTPSSGAVPFAVDFDRKGHLLVVEAGANAVSSYAIAHDGSLHVISASVPNGQAATCWIVVNKRGDIITTNPGTNSLSSFRVNAGTGQVTLLNGTAGAGDAPLDIDLTDNGRFAYAVDPANGGVDMFRVGHDGSLTGLGNVNGGLSIFAQGMAVD